MGVCSMLRTTNEQTVDRGFDASAHYALKIIQQAARTNAPSFLSVQRCELDALVLLLVGGGRWMIWVQTLEHCCVVFLVKLHQC